MQTESVFPLLSAGYETGYAERRSEVRNRAIRGLVLAGVHAWGNDSLEQAICRPLLPVALRPLIAHSLTWLRDGGATEACVCANSQTSLLRRRLGDGTGLDLALRYDEDRMPRGPAGCVRDAYLSAEFDALIVADGTIVPDFDPAPMLRSHFDANASLTVVVSSTAGPGGAAEGTLEPIGVYVFSPDVLSSIPARSYQDIKESLIPRLRARGERVMMHVVADGVSPRVADAQSYQRVNMWVVERILAGGDPPHGYVRVGDAFVHESARMANDTRIIGPVLIGPSCHIAEGSTVIGPTVVGARSRIATNAVVSRTTIWEDCEVGEGAIVDQSILTNRARVAVDFVVRHTIVFQ
ncbi:MAG: NDP-sugar synthase [Planctomycetes bacterium]|nr:NDP-sugar synthase [Planctomycetota bacterium]